MELISYAADFASFIVQNFKEIKKIKAIILFGSAARGEAGKESDVDIFVDVIAEEKKTEKEIKKITNDFFDSVKFKKYWKLLGIKNEINVIVGNLDKWKLKDSMLGNALVLYQNYAPRLENGKNKVILSWGNIKPNSRRVMLNKKIFGYNYYGKRYKGALEKYEGRKIGSNVIIINTEFLNLFLKIFHGFKIAVKLMRIFEYT